jgi:hypothetical protein
VHALLVATDGAVEADMFPELLIDARHPVIVTIVGVCWLQLGLIHICIYTLFLHFWL